MCQNNFSDIYYKYTQIRTHSNFMLIDMILRNKFECLQKGVTLVKREMIRWF